MTRIILTWRTWVVWVSLQLQWARRKTPSSANPCTKDTTTANDHDSVSHYRPQREAGDEGDKKKGTGKSSVSTKRSRAAAIHNQSERKRRDKINQRMKHCKNWSLILARRIKLQCLMK
ncbi:hypothetical protein Dsin_026415 [Dipteronia sinensis]|uniref:BHLH domain-containing protein n=1 Tax=Dipteronia sinensis TaxID=43782 RepID=A0AAE0DXS7_9ROSI|nr:hypothetical protein Dsin_026415 [Dipteronia sinensis]